MPCYTPLQAFFTVRDDGKKSIIFSNAYAKLFAKGCKLPSDSISLPCGKCIGCRLERSRQWGVRCLHESMCYEDNIFVTLTYSDEHLPPNGSLCRLHVQNFMKKLRSAFVPPCPDGFDEDKWNEEFGVRVYGCGEYGEKFSRPHYHLCLFNLDFHDKKKKFKIGDYWQYSSEVLSSLWQYGNATFGDFSFETAAYCARYCLKKVNGPEAEKHYGAKVPEFPIFSNRPGIGKPFLDRFGRGIFDHDSVVVRGHLCKPPRYYDVIRDRIEPEVFVSVKDARRLRAVSKSADLSFDRLQTRLKCQQARMNFLLRKMESACC